MRTLMRARCSHGAGRCLKCVEHELLNYAEEGQVRVRRADGAMDFAPADKAANAQLVAIQLRAAEQANGRSKFYDALIYSGALRALAQASSRSLRASTRAGADEDAAGKKAVAAALRAAARALAKTSRSGKAPKGAKTLPAKL